MPRGSLPLKVRIPGCAPIRRASGTDDKKIRRALVRMVHTLHEQGRDDLVNAIAAGRLRPLQVYSQFRFNRLEDLPHADELPLLRETWRTWLADLECSDDHRYNTRLYFERWEKRLPETATIGDIVPLLATLRNEMRTRARSFNLGRSNVLAFLRDILGHRHKAWLDAADVLELKVRPKRLKHPLTPDQLRELVRKLGDPYGPMAWTMATTGMGWKEYSGPWEREGEGLRIRGTKTAGRDRLIPIASLLYRPTGTIYAFRWHLHKVSDGRVTPYDLRRTFAGLMVEAGIPRPRRKSYMGHTAGDITGLYEWQEVREYLLKDAEKLRAHLGEPIGGPVLRVMRA